MLVRTPSLTLKAVTLLAGSVIEASVPAEVYASVYVLPAPSFMVLSLPPEYVKLIPPPVHLLQLPTPQAE